jgi:hypothetical protein
MIIFPFDVAEICQRLPLAGIIGSLCLEFFFAIIILMQLPIEKANSEMHAGLAGSDFRRDSNSSIPSANSLTPWQLKPGRVCACGFFGSSASTCRKWCCRCRLDRGICAVLQATDDRNR